MGKTNVFKYVPGTARQFHVAAVNKNGPGKLKEIVPVRVFKGLHLCMWGLHTNKKIPSSIEQLVSYLVCLTSTSTLQGHTGTIMFLTY